MGLPRDSDAGHVRYTRGFQNLTGQGTVSNSAGHFWRSLQRDLRGGPYRDVAVLPHWFWAIEAWRMKFFKFSLVEFDNEWFEHWSHELDISLCQVFSSVKKKFRSGGAIFCLVEKLQSKILIDFKEIIRDQNLITKEGRIFESPLCLRLGCGIKK